jgi:hypothetical protein
MQSTGQALMHSVQPMHQASSITASARAFVAAAGSSGSTGRPVIAPAADAFGAAGRAAVDGRRPLAMAWA